MCSKIGRNPKTLKRSLLIYGEKALNLFEQEDNFSKYVEKYSGIGIEEFIFYYSGKENMQKHLKKLLRRYFQLFDDIFLKKQNRNVTKS
ncbi:MAG: hypothetical protein HGN29_03115 [Asgard group archaeon]|nr:hypothetical protein [Asgard group archaeon]